MADNRELLVFLVDDDEIYLKGIEHHLKENLKYKVTLRTFKTGEEVLQAIGEKPDIIFLDHYLDSVKKDALNGMEILKRIHKEDEDIHVIILSGQDKIEVAIDTMKYGAFDYIVKTEGAMVRAQNVVGNVVRMITQAELLRSYKIGFIITLIVLAVIIIFAISMYMICPDCINPSHYREGDPINVG
ncbi:MAG: response regulator [Bacteroidetes bacterium]|nr:response regulator [Bacteroidota bacterium]